MDKKVKAAIFTFSPTTTPTPTSISKPKIFHTRSPQNQTPTSAAPTTQTSPPAPGVPQTAESH